MRIRSQLRAATALAIGVLVLVSASLAYVSHLGERTLRNQQLSQEVGRDVASLLTLTLEYTLYLGQRPADQWHARHARLRQTIATARAAAAQDPDLTALDAQAADLGLLFAQLEQVAGAPESPIQGRRRDLLVDRLAAELQDLVELRFAWARAIGQADAQQQQQLALIVLAGPGLLLLLGAGLGLMVSRQVLAPLVRLEALSLAIRHGDLTLPSGSNPANELGDAAAAVQAMAQSLLTANAALQHEIGQRHHSEEQLRLMMNASPLGMFTTDLAGNCLYANQALQRITGLGAAACLGLGLRQALHPGDLAQVLALRGAVLASGEVQSSEHRMLRPDGQPVWVRANLARLQGDALAETFVGTIEDVTERRQLDAALAQKTAALARSNEDLARFAYVASHDLQEPLRMVNSYGQLLTRRHKAQLDAEAQEFLGFMVEGGQRALALIRDLLSLARVDSQSKPMTPVSLQEVLAETLRDLHDKLHKAGVALTHSSLPSVTGDRLQLGQLLGNLISNAIKFRGPDAPQVHVDASREAGFWRITVSDNGIGIDPKYFDRIFRMFQRLHQRPEHAGTGIGLAVCKRVVERHGGHIGVDSVPGQGSTFHFTLPDAPVATPGWASPHSNPSA